MVQTIACLVLHFVNHCFWPLVCYPITQVMNHVLLITNVVLVNH